MNPHRIECRHCSESISTSAIVRHEKTCLVPRTLPRLYEVGKVVRQDDGCHVWTGALVNQGYGKHKDGLAHRLALELSGRPPSVGLEACHTCHVRTCVNPAHLYWGTRADNMRDMLAAGRGGGFITMTREQRVAGGRKSSGKGVAKTPEHRAAIGAGVRARNIAKKNDVHQPSDRIQ